MQNRRRLISILASAAMLSGCGFRLRGAGEASTFPFSSIYLELPPKSPLESILRRYLRADGKTVIADSPQAAEVALSILAETRDKTILSLNSQGRVREFGLSYRLTYRVTAGGQELLGPTELVSNQTMTFTEGAALGKESEEALIYRDLQNDLAQQILRRLSVLPLPERG